MTTNQDNPVATWFVRHILGGFVRAVVWAYKAAMRAIGVRP
jgi:hypothetical protein